MPFRAYVAELNKNLRAGASEPTYYPALKSLLESLGPPVDAFTNLGHIEVGYPDFEIRQHKRGAEFPIGWVEAKQPGEDLDEIEKGDQLQRYRRLPNLILTDFVEFRLYEQGKRILTARLGTVGRKKLSPDPQGEAQVRQLLEQFLRAPFVAPRNPKELAKWMAGLAHIIRDTSLQTFKREPEDGELHTQFEAFKTTLIPDLKPEQFADMYAQTIAYGLFAARCQHTGQEPFTREKAAYLIPKTNPFLQKLFLHIAGPTMDDRLTPFVDHLAVLLHRSDFNSILADFGKRTAKEDPVVHFYEDFLQAYDPKVREMRGVYYTPEPVVSYIVRSVDHLLKTRFNKPDGLADPSVLILDPACGTGTFLYYVIRLIYDTMVNKKGQKGVWNSYVSQNLLKRVFGFEILMPPYAIAHLKLGLLLKELGYTFDTDERLGIYLTNTLEEAIKTSERLFAKFIADEANAAAEIKKDKPIMVVIGNPPYSNFGRMNRGKWILELLKDYKKGLKEKKLNIDDDFIKFLRFGQWRIDRTDYGILGFITNNTYLDGITHRRMRESLLESFHEVYALNLHGSVRKREKAPGGGPDENVFDIQQGVAIALLAKTQNQQQARRVQHADLWGTRAHKYTALYDSDASATDWQPLEPSAPQFFLVPKDLGRLGEYTKLPSIEQDIFEHRNAGIQTKRDHLVYHITKEELRATLLDLQKLPPEELRQKYNLPPDGRDWQVRWAQEDTRENTGTLCQVAYRPFDHRFAYYTGKTKGLMAYPRHPLMESALLPNLLLLTVRNARRGNVDSFFVANTAVDKDSVSPFDNVTFFPLYVYDAGHLDAGTRKGRLGGRLFSGGEPRQINLKESFIKGLEQELGLTLAADPGRVGPLPEDVFCYIYSILYSPAYRQRYAEFLKIDFPRVPLTSSKKLFRALAEKGHALISLHLMESPKLSQFITHFPLSGDNTVEKPRYDEKKKRVYINKTQYFEGVPKDVWEFHIGGYQVCEKWLKDRKGRTLSADDLDHYQKVVVALHETIRLMKGIDDLIPGWPLP